jgi:hypothetical protein
MAPSRPLPRLVELTQHENGRLIRFSRSCDRAIATQYMLSLAEERASKPAPPLLPELLWQITRGDLAEATRALAKLEEDDEFEPVRSDTLIAAARTFTESFAVIVPIEKEGERRILKFAYDEVVSGKPRLPARLGLEPATFVIRLSDLGDAGSRHLEFLRAEGLEIFDAAMLGRTPDRTPLEQGPGTQARSDEAHLFIAGAPRSSTGVAGVRLRPQREGILASGPLFAAIVGIALTAAWFSLPDLADESNSVASVLLAVPAALGAFFGTRNPHPLAREMLTGARWMVIASGICAFAAAGALAVDSSVEALRWVVGLVALPSWLIVAGLAWLSIASRPKPRATSRSALQ